MASHAVELVTGSEEQAGDETGPYILRPLLEEVPLSTDGFESNVKINCVEYYGKYDNVPVAMWLSLKRE